MGNKSFAFPDALAVLAVVLADGKPLRIEIEKDGLRAVLAVGPISEAAGTEKPAPIKDKAVADLERRLSAIGAKKERIFYFRMFEGSPLYGALPVPEGQP